MEPEVWGILKALKNCVHGMFLLIVSESSFWSDNILTTIYVYACILEYMFSNVK
jgi:hypothetical protein